ncbi:MAG: GNAT family N-acetyltransferase, partial [Halorhabdus sp.]
MKRLPLWRLTRTDTGRWLWDTLATRGIRLTRLSLYRIDDLDVETPDLDPDVRLSVRRANALRPRDGSALFEPEDWILQARSVDGVVGSVVLSIGREVWIPPLDCALSFDGGYLWALSVDKSHRRRGIASALVARALAVTAEETDACFALVAADNRPSQRVFEGLGFTAVGAVTHVAFPGVRWTSDVDALPDVCIVRQ